MQRELVVKPADSLGLRPRTNSARWGSPSRDPCRFPRPIKGTSTGVKPHYLQSGSRSTISG